jgi:hypothetical protein
MDLIEAIHASHQIALTQAPHDTGIIRVRDGLFL